MATSVGNILDKLGLKKGLLRVYFGVTNACRDSVAWGRKKVIPRLAGRRSRNGVYAVCLDSDWLGLGARIVKTLEILQYCDERGLIPVIRYGYLEKDEPDYFGELFSWKPAYRQAGAAARFTRVRDNDELGWPEDYNRKLRLDSAKELFDKYLSIDPGILSEVNEFTGSRFGNQAVLGVHYRGTDKAGEAPLVAQEYLRDAILAVLREDPRLQCIFLSTDDAKIIHYLRNANLPVPVIFREDAVRSDDGDQFHRKKEVSKSVVNRDAIVNMLILSRCQYLLKTASILSDCSVVFNPTIQFRLISKPHSENLTWWPCRELIRIQTDAYAIAKTERSDKSWTEL